MDWINHVAGSCLKDLDLCWGTPEISILGRSMSPEMSLLGLTVFSLRGHAVILNVVGVQAPSFWTGLNFLPSSLSAPFLRMVCYLVNRCSSQALGASTVVHVLSFCSLWGCDWHRAGGELTAPHSNPSNTTNNKWWGEKHSFTIAVVKK